jgi:hypothetical protein
MTTLQFERVAGEGEEWLPVFALALLGRVEEASLLAYKRAEEQADVSTLFTFLNMTGRSDELISYLEERWTDLDALREDFPPYGGFGDALMLDVALAYSRMGKQQRFDEAIDQIRVVHEDLKAQGVNNQLFFMSEASYQAMAGDLEASLDYLNQALDRGLVATNRIVDSWPYLEPLEGEQRFEELQSLMIEKVTAEREKLGLEPAAI